MSQHQHDQGSDRELHRLHDGDLPPDEAAALRARVASSAQARAKLAALGELRAAVRHAAPVPDASESEALWARIAAEVAAPAKPAADEAAKRPALRVVAGGRAAEPSPREQATPQPMAAAHAHDGRGRRLATVIIASLAVAAATLLVLLRPGEEQVAEEAHDEQTQQPDEGAALASQEPSHTEVLEVDFGMNTGTVFAVEGEGGERYAVVWLADEEKKTTALE